MIVKPSIRFLGKDSDANLITGTGAILTAMTAATGSYPAPVPTLAVVTNARDEFSTAVAEAADGGKTLTAIKNDKRAALVALLRQLASYVQVTCHGDLTVLLSSGFPIQKPQREPIGVLPAPTNLKVELGSRSGELRAAATPVPGGAIYNWKLTTAATPTVVVQTAQTTGANNTFTDLMAGVLYYTTVNVVGSAGPSNWSDPVPQMAV